MFLAYCGNAGEPCPTLIWVNSCGVETRFEYSGWYEKWSSRHSQPNLAQSMRFASFLGICSCTMRLEPLTTVTTMTLSGRLSRKLSVDSMGLLWIEAFSAKLNNCRRQRSASSAILGSYIARNARSWSSHLMYEVRLKDVVSRTTHIHITSAKNLVSVCGISGATAVSNSFSEKPAFPFTRQVLLVWRVFQ